MVLKLLAKMENIAGPGHKATVSRRALQSDVRQALSMPPAKVADLSVPLKKLEPVKEEALNVNSHTTPLRPVRRLELSQPRARLPQGSRGAGQPTSPPPQLKT